MTKGCYTCRRRRIICDNGLPTCRKCRDAGKECLGYQKPLVWVKGGVASRGKMMGRSFDDVAQNTSDRSSEDDSNAAADPPPPEVGAQGQDSLDTGLFQRRAFPWWIMFPRRGAWLILYSKTWIRYQGSTSHTVSSRSFFPREDTRCI